MQQIYARYLAIIFLDGYKVCLLPNARSIVAALQQKKPGVFRVCGIAR